MATTPRCVMITPSLTRNPAARSKSAPGVRMVTASDVPPTRSSSGSSPAKVSRRCVDGSPTVTRSTSRWGVMRLTSSSCSRAESAERPNRSEHNDGGSVPYGQRSRVSRRMRRWQRPQQNGSPLLATRSALRRLAKKRSTRYWRWLVSPPIRQSERRPRWRAGWPRGPDES